MPRSETGEDNALHRWRDRVQADSAKHTAPHSERRPSREFSTPPRTIAQAAEELGLSAHTVRSWVTARRLAHIRLGRAIRIPAAEIRRVIEENTVPAIEER
jgi:excisionase family DNA binding protein